MQQHFLEVVHMSHTPQKKHCEQCPNPIYISNSCEDLQIVQPDLFKPDSEPSGILRKKAGGVLYSKCSIGNASFSQVPRFAGCDGLKDNARCPTVQQNAACEQGDMVDPRHAPLPERRAFLWNWQETESIVFHPAHAATTQL